MTLKGAIADLQNLIDSDGIPFWAKPSLQKVKETIEELVKPCIREVEENDEEEPQKDEKTEHDKVIVVQIDCLMPMQNVMVFRKELLAQMKEGIIVIPPWAHVSHVGDECKIEIKKMEEERSEETN